MPSSLKPDKIKVECPHCGHIQDEPRTCISTVCKSCRKNFSLEAAAKPKTKSKAAPAKPAPTAERKKVTCFDCGTVLEVPLEAQSTMCKRCSRYMDLKDYHISSAVSKNFKTKGLFEIQPTGYVFNTEVTAGEAVIKGRLLGKLATEGSLTIHTSAEIKGSFTAGRLVIPAENHFRWREPIKAGAADIAGELAADLRTTGTIVLRATGRMFGDLQGGGLVVEEGAVVVGYMRIGVKAAEALL